MQQEEHSSRLNQMDEFVEPLETKFDHQKQCTIMGTKCIIRESSVIVGLVPPKLYFKMIVIFVRHGGVFVRVSPNRLMKANNVFCKTDERPAAKTTRGEQFESSTDDGCDDLMLNDSDKQNNENEIQEEPLHFVHDRQDTNNTKVDLKKDERIRYKIEEFDKWT